MKILIEYDSIKEKYYFNFDGFELKTFYGFYLACEELGELLHDYSRAEHILNQVQNSDFGIIIEV